MTVRAIVFDAYGTLYDVQSVRTVITEMCGARGELITQLWRLKQLEYTWLRGLMQHYEDLWGVTRDALEFSLRSVGIEPDAKLCDRLLSKYLSLDLYSEAKEALDQLGEYELAILSNGSPHMLEALVASTGVSQCFSAVISVDLVKAFKPDPACYALVERTLGVAPKDVLFVSSNGFDVAGAKRFGFKVAWIARAQGILAPTNSDVGPTEFYRLLRGGEEQLGGKADVRVARLTELAPLIKALGAEA